MPTSHFEVLVEDLSTEVYLNGVLPRMLGTATFSIYSFQGKSDLLGKLPARLRSYSRWLPDDWKIVVVLDRDGADCVALKAHLNAATAQAGLRSRSTHANWQVVSRMAIEELEAWYFGDWPAVERSFPRVPLTIPKQAKYRSPDGIVGGTWEALERILQRAGYFPGGMRKIEVARLLGEATDPDQNTSSSFRTFRDALVEALT